MTTAAMLSLLPMALTYGAWRSIEKTGARLPDWRLMSFGFGLLLSILCSLLVAYSWFDPYPLDFLHVASFCGALLLVGLALFGRGVARLLLAAGGLLLAFLAYVAILSNID